MKKRQTYPLERHVKYWQKRFKLTDFDFEIEWRDEEGMKKFFEEDSPEKDAIAAAKIACAATSADGPLGVDTTSLEHRQVKMVFKKGAFDSEREAVSTLIHEMVHNLLWPIAVARDSHLERVMEEQIVNTLEEAFLELAYPERR